MKVGPSRQGRNPGEAWLQPRAFTRQAGIRSAGTNCDPVTVVARLFRKTEVPRKHGSVLKLKAIPAVGAVNRGLKVVPSAYRDRLARAGGRRKRAIHIEPWQFSWPVNLPLLCGTLSQENAEQQGKKTGEFQAGPPGYLE